MNIKISKFTCLFLTLGFILITIIISVLVANHEISTIKYFFETQAIKKENYSTAINTFKQLADDKNISLENRNSATVKTMELATNALLEFKIEANLKVVGYKYVICFIDTNVVRIIIKPNFMFTRSNFDYIKNTVTELTSIKNVKLTIKK